MTGQETYAEWKADYDARKASRRVLVDVQIARSVAAVREAGYNLRDALTSTDKSMARFAVAFAHLAGDMEEHD